MDSGSVRLVVAVLVGSAAMYGLIRWKASSTRKAVERYYVLRGEEVTIVSSMSIPPIRLWLRNRKGDGWAKVCKADDSVVWIRVRNTVWGDTTYEEFA